MVKGGSPSAAAAIGGATGIGSQRCGGHTVSGSSPLAPPRTSASVEPVSPAANDCTGLRADDGLAVTAQHLDGRGGEPRLADFGAGAGDDERSCDRSPVEAGSQRGNEPVDLLGRVRGRERDAQSCGPGRHRRRTDRGHQQPACRATPPRRRARARSSPHIDGHDRRAVARAHPFDVRSAGGRRARALGPGEHARAPRARPQCRPASTRS